MSAFDFAGFKKHIEANADSYVARLGEAVAIDGVSGDVSRRPKVLEMGTWLETQMKKLDIAVERRDLGMEKVKTEAGETEIPLPPVLLGQYGSDPKKKTLCVYGHYDVQPASKSDGWDTEPFVLTEVDGRLCGRGSSDDKGPVLGWLWVIEACRQLKVELPVNIKMVFEGMEESGSIGLDEVIDQEKNAFLKDVDCFCISDNYWLGTTKPCITYGLRGITYFYLTVEGTTKDLHSGVFGGTVHEPMIDCVKILASLVDCKGNILIDGVDATVAPVTEEEKARYAPIDFTKEGYASDAGLVKGVKLPHEDKVELLMRRWRFPSLSVHGIEGAYYESGAKTVIPRKVIGKFSIRLVPDQQPDDIIKKVQVHIEKEFAKYGSSNKVSCECPHGGKPWVSDIEHPSYVAAAKATKQVYGVDPDMTREGGSIPVTLTFQEKTKKNVMLLPMGRSDDGAHSQNEKLDRSNYINGIQLMGAYIFHLAELLQ